MYERLYGERLQDYEARLRHQWIEVRAYYIWCNDNKPNGRALDHWLQAEREYDDLERRFGCPPYQAERLARYEQYQRLAI